MLQAVIDVAKGAGRIVEEVRASADLLVSEKGDQGPVTEADKRSDAYLREHLLALEEAGWLSEETADTPDRLAHRRLWVVDPLDGTKEFIQGVPQYSVAIALVEDGDPVLAVIHQPSNGNTYWAIRGGGTFRDGAQVRVTEGTGMLTSRTEMKRGEFEPFAGAWTLQPIGSIALKLAMVAAGAAAVTLSRGPKWEWDVCAGSLLVQEAGGHVSDMFGGALRFNNRFPKCRGVVGGAPAAYGRVMGELRAIGASDRMNEIAGGGSRER